MAGNKKGGAAGIRAAIDAAETVPPLPASPAGEAPTLRVIGGAMEMRRDGLYRVPSEGVPLRIAGPFDVMSQTRDEDAGTWGLLLRFRDPDGAVQTQVVPRDLFAGEGGELRSLLARRSLYINPAQSVRGLLAEYLSRVETDRRARIVNRTGWHRVDGALAFVLPDRTFGKTATDVIYQPASQDQSLFNLAGTLDGWRSGVAAPCEGNSRLMLAVSAAFAGPLLDIVGEDGGGIHFRGASRTGKTTALRVAASVCGGSGAGGAAGYVRQWRATGNGTEGMAAAHSDTLLALDELGQADPREVGDTAYMLASGQGKVRSDRAGGLRAAARFRVLFLSTGELSLADKIAEGGQRVRAGQEVRLVDVPADAGAGMGVFEELHGAADAEALIGALRAATTANYGTPLVAFLQYVLSQVAAEPAFADDLRDWIGSLVKQWTEARPDAGGQVRSVARRFALVAVAGELSVRADITGWLPDRASDAARTCFEAWLAGRGFVGAQEDVQAVAQLRDFLTRHGDARFQEWREPVADDAKQSPPEATPPPTDRFRTPNRAGWKRRVGEGEHPFSWEYYLTVEAMKEALAGLDKRQANRVLVDRGFVRQGSKETVAGTYWPPGHGAVRLYRVLPGIFGAADGDG